MKKTCFYVELTERNNTTYNKFIEFLDSHRIVYNNLNQNNFYIYMPKGPSDFYYKIIEMKNVVDDNILFKNKEYGKKYKSNEYIRYFEKLI